MIDYQVGSIVAYHLHNLLQLGKITAMETGYISFIDPAGLLLRLPIQRFCLFSTAVYDLEDFRAKLLQRTAALELNQIANIFCSREGLSWEEYSSASNLVDDVERFAHYFFIRQHPELISWKKHKFHLRDESELEAYKLELKKVQEREEFLLELQAWLELYLEDNSIGIPDNMALAFKHELPDYLLTGTQTDLTRAISQIRPELELESKIRMIRLSLGEISDHTDPILGDSGLPVRFSKELGLSLLQVQYPLAEGVEAFSIDDEDSEDFDDALSVSSLETGYRIGIHISAVAARIPFGSELYQEAARRVSSLYLAPGVTPLLPEELSNQELSLVSGSDKACLSFYVETDLEYQIQACQFRLERVKIKDNFSYSGIDRLLHKDPFDTLRKFSSALSAERGNQVQTRIPKEVGWYVHTDGKRIRLRRIDHNSPARILIEELMVLFNRNFADYAVLHQIPLIFRNINQFSPDGEENNISSQAYLSTTAEFHPGIGTNAYVHATSPIRRFTDLVNQYQLISRLTGRELPFTEDDLTALIPKIEERLLRQREIIQRSGRYWLLKLIEQDYLQVPLAAEVVKYVRNGVMIELTQWHKRIHLQTDSYAPQDTEVQIVITQVFPKEGYAIGDIIS